jgi:Fe-S cluster biosynthesis and repair protein YggX
MRGDKPPEVETIISAIDKRRYNSWQNKNECLISDLKLNFTSMKPDKIYTGK